MQWAMGNVTRLAEDRRVKLNAFCIHICSIFCSSYSLESHVPWALPMDPPREEITKTQRSRCYIVRFVPCFLCQELGFTDAALFFTWFVEPCARPLVFGLFVNSHFHPILHRISKWMRSGKQRNECATYSHPIEFVGWICAIERRVFSIHSKHHMKEEKWNVVLRHRLDPHTHTMCEWVSARQTYSVLFKLLLLLGVIILPLFSACYTLRLFNFT